MNKSLLSVLYLSLWRICYYFIFRPSPPLFHRLRIFLLNCFGADVSYSAIIYPSCSIYNPKYLVVKDRACISYCVKILNTTYVTLEADSVISQYSFICTGSHDHFTFGRPLVSKPIIIGHSSWICADVYIGPGVSVGSSSIIAARSTIYKNVPSNSVVSSTSDFRVISRI